MPNSRFRKTWPARTGDWPHSAILVEFWNTLSRLPIWVSRMRVIGHPHRWSTEYSCPMPAVVTELPQAVVALPTDRVLLDRFAAGDRAAFDELFRRHRGVAFRVAYRLLGHEADALDAVQDGFIKVLTHLDRFHGRSSFKTWLLRIVSNAALDIGRQRKRAIRFPQMLGDDSTDRFGPGELPAADEELTRADLRTKIDAALARLPENQRQTFVLHVDGGLAYREIAEVLGISIGTVMSRLYYARQKLKPLLADQIEP
jgi:RNA polymerase sigma-70 factor, ECF subfamily